MKLSIFTLNIWGLRFVSKYRTARVKALAECLINNEYDIVCLQELWCDEDYKYLKQSCEQIFKFIHYFHSGMLGSGMCIMSRYPMVDVHYHSFSLNGYLHMMWHGDWFGGKGIGLCRINVKGFIVNVYTTHLHACYSPTNDKYLKHRVIQAYETANFIRITASGSNLAVLAGDLNSCPNDICYKLICLGANLKDCYSTCLKNNINYTFNHPRNYFKNLKESECRLDYILYKFNKSNSVTVKEHRHSLPGCVPGQNYSYSDHEPIEAVFEVSDDEFNFDIENKNNDMVYEEELQEVLNISRKLCDEKSIISPLISMWHYAFLIILLLCIYYLPLSFNIFINENYILKIIFVILIFKVMWIYNLIIKSIEQNCIRGFLNQIETLFYE